VDCVTLLGNSLCLFPGEECEDIFHEAGRMLSAKGIFIIDLPDPSYIGVEPGETSKTSQTFNTKTLGEVKWEWVRYTNGEKKNLYSQETIHFCENKISRRTRRLTFKLTLHSPEEVRVFADACRLYPEKEFICLDTSGRYKGLLRKRTIFILRKGVSP
jgi:hypothetical protein